MFSTADYLNRINITSAPSPTLSSLRKIQYQHLLHIPFENLDIHYNNPIILQPDKLFDKVINNHRGGFCFELNGLLYELLTQLGFQAKRISARVHQEGEEFSPDFDHLALIVTIKEIDWLVDVGFGDFAYAPLNISLRDPQQGPRGTFRIKEHEPGMLLVQHQDEKGKWIHDYIFSTAPQSLKAFNKRCHFHQTSEKSHFSKKKICSKATPEGRITVTDKELKIKRQNDTQKYNISDNKEFKQLIAEHFGIAIP